MLRFLRMGNKRTKTIWWILIIVTVVTFLGGFIFMFGAGLDSTQGARISGAVGTVNGKPIKREEYQAALAEQRATYQRQYNTQPTEQDQRVVELQAWRGLISQHLLSDQALASGLAATDREVVLTMQSNPPSLLLASPAFQTDGKFDPSKYQAALTNPGNNWGEVEDLVRAQLPMRKLQERLISSLKITEGELRQAYQEQNERISATVLQIPPRSDLKVPPPTDADLQRTYDQFKNRFISGARTLLEVLAIPKKFGQEEIRVARELAAGLVQRARAGEDFAQLAKDYSEGPGAAEGGVLPRVITPQEFGPELAPKLLALPVGGVSEPEPDASRFIIFKIIERAPGPNGSVLGLRLAQIVVKSRPNEATLAEQNSELQKIRSRATRIGLGKAASEKGLSTRRSEPFDFNNPPQSLFMVPQAGDWGLSAKVGAVSPVFEGVDEFLIAQVAEQHAAGPATRQSLTEPLRNISELVARVEATKPRADSAAAMVKAGRPLEEVASALGIPTYRVEGATRAQPDPRLSGSDDVTGALFAARPGQVVGPFRALNGWYLARLEGKAMAGVQPFDSLRTQLSSQILQQRQRAFMNGYMAELRARAKVEDLRSEQ
ncbi:MAG: SurA N-terminal domain-containing protein [Candidatus Eisenbacteria bacterium]